MQLTPGAIFPDDLPETTGQTTLGPVSWPVLLGIAPFRGQHAAVDAALAPLLGIGLPPIGTRVSEGDHRLFWSGRGQYLLVTHEGLTRRLEEALSGLAALVAQTDGWAGLAVTGAGAEAVMARLCGLDLRPDMFGPEAVARCEVAHMPGLVQRHGDGFEIWVPASYALFLMREMRHAMALVAGRDALG